MVKRKYNLRDKDNKKEIEKSIRKGIKSSKSGRKILTDLQDKGMGYNEKQFYEDMRKIHGEYIPKKVLNKTTKKVTQRYVLPKTSGAKRKKEKWFNEVFEPFRKENNLTSKQASRIIKQETKTTHKLIKDMRTGKKYYDKYKKVF